ncbi:hypothetical protein NLI96_g10767 [Meripilus lineatus]|uniref:Uncharacterized protein n=1 Tax=Meripilus lineatus TaxID=2056292 RepID=A0AAD5UVE1_9APHY|nr:hypothetical protein NLI96_g10767 [Physisporinus lineatus]
MLSNQKEEKEYCSRGKSRGKGKMFIGPRRAMNENAPQVRTHQRGYINNTSLRQTLLGLIKIKTKGWGPTLILEQESEMAHGPKFWYTPKPLSGKIDSEVERRKGYWIEPSGSVVW